MNNNTNKVDDSDNKNSTTTATTNKNNNNSNTCTSANIHNINIPPFSKNERPLHPSIKPKPPTKPPSLRSKQINNHTIEEHTNNEESKVDHTSLAFQEVRARFQKHTSETAKQSNNRQRLVHLKEDTSSMSSLHKARPTAPQTARRPHSIVADMSERFELEAANSILTRSGSSTRPTLLSPSSPPPAPESAASTISRRKDIDNQSYHHLSLPKRLSIHTLTSHRKPVSPTQTSSSHMTGTGNCGLSSSSSLSSSPVAASSSSLSSSPSPSPSPYQSVSARNWTTHGQIVSHWLGANTTEHQQQQQQQQRHQHLSVKELPTMPKRTSLSSFLSSPPSSSEIETTTATGVTSNSPGHALSNNQHRTPMNDAGSASSSSIKTSSGTTNGKESKRVKIINEIMETERIYQSDMLVLKEIYYDQALLPHSGFSSSDVKHVYSNLLAIIHFESVFVEKLASALQTDNIGLVFMEKMEEIDQVYCDYCKRHEDAVIRLQELETIPKTQVFLQTCAEQLQGRTQSWDLGSLLIKPVQRVLKYPLLLKELSIVTPSDHPDYDNLVTATMGIQKVADHINEIKRRKDIVEKIVGDKKKTDINVVHGINKKLTRKAHRIRQVTGLAAEATQDTLFDTLHQKFESQQEVVRQLARSIQAWVRHVKDNFDNLLEFATSLEEMYTAFGGVRVRSMNQIKEFTKVASTFRMVISRDLDTMVHGYIYSRIENFLSVFENPSQVISKRAQKLLDYDRVRGIKARGDMPDKALQDSADMYVSINAQLVEELPLLFNLTRQYFDIIVEDVAMVQTKFYEHTCREWNKLIQHLRKHASVEHSFDYDSIIDRYQEEMRHHVQPLIDDIVPLNKEQWKTVLGVSMTPLTEDLTGTSRSKASDSYFDSASSAQSFNDEDTQSSISSRKYGSPMWKSTRAVVGDTAGTSLTDDDSSKATTPQYDDYHNKLTATNNSNNNNKNDNNSSSNSKNVAEPAFECLVIHDYLESSLEALCVHKGDVIQVWAEDEDDQGQKGAWLYASLSLGQAEHFGWIPSQYCQLL